MNTSLGWPTLSTRPGVVVLDRTSFRSQDTLDRALQWTREHRAARVILLTELGDRPLVTGDEGNWVVWPWTPQLRNHLRNVAGSRPAGSTLSMNALGLSEAGQITAAVYRAPALSQLRADLLRTVAVARQVRGGDFPRPVADAVRLVNACMNTWGSLESANQWAVLEPRGTSTATLAAAVERASQYDLQGPWATFRETHWPDLRRQSCELYKMLREFNPRFEMLLYLLDRAALESPEDNVIIRVGSRTAARALEEQLAAARLPIKEQIARGSLLILAESERRPWASKPTREIRLGVPPPWRRSSLFSGECTHAIVAVDELELKWLEASVAVSNRDWQRSLNLVRDQLGWEGLSETFSAPTLARIGPIPVDDRGEELIAESAVNFGVDMTVLFSEFQTAVETADLAQEREALGGIVSARTITLGPDASTFCLRSDSVVDVVMGTRFVSCKVSELTVGSSMVVSRGEGRKDLYQRLLAATHDEHDVATLELLLAAFRRAVMNVYDRCGASWPAAAKLINQRGGTVKTGLTVKEWASGKRIAPEDPVNIKVVARIAGDSNLTLDDMWRRVGHIADELRAFHTDLGRCLSAAIREAAQGVQGENLRRLSALAGGVDLTEILEEFQLRPILAVGPSASVQASSLRRPIALAEF